jgi:hypothetical protein
MLRDGFSVFSPHTSVPCHSFSVLSPHQCSIPHSQCSLGTPVFRATLSVFSRHTNVPCHILSVLSAHQCSVPHSVFSRHTSVPCHTLSVLSAHQCSVPHSQRSLGTPVPSVTLSVTHSQFTLSIREPEQGQMPLARDYTRDNELTQLGGGDRRVWCHGRTRTLQNLFVSHYRSFHQEPDNEPQSVQTSGL